MKWLEEPTEHLDDNTQFMANGFIHSSVSHTLDHTEEDSSGTSPNYTTDVDDHYYREISEEKDCTMRKMVLVKIVLMKRTVQMILRALSRPDSEQYYQY